MALFERIVDNQSERSLAHRMRRRRFARFAQFLADVPRPFQILDIGGTQAFWDRMHFQDPEITIVLLNLSAADGLRPGFVGIAGDARKLAFPDGHFAVVISNSVIEHLRTWEEQMAMATEVRRVAKRYWIQTPNRWFPIEPHAVVPGLQFLPQQMQGRIVGRLRPGWYRHHSAREAAREASEVRLLTGPEMRKLFPDGELWRERFLGLTKSLVAHSGPPS
jgi:SAM-dependent methyltransferase